MTPPSVIPNTSSPTEGEEEEGGEGEESSGLPPDDLAYDDDADAKAEWPPRIAPEKWHKELSVFETSSAPSDGSLPQPGGEGGFSLLGGGERKPDRSENETRDILKTFFCGKTCTKICPKGFQVSEQGMQFGGRKTVRADVLSLEEERG